MIIYVLIFEIVNISNIYQGFFRREWVSAFIPSPFLRESRLLVLHNNPSWLSVPDINDLFQVSIRHFFVGNSMTIFTYNDKLISPQRFLSRVLIIFILEKFCSTEVVPTGIDKQMFAMMLKLGNIAMSMLFLVNSFSCACMSSLGC